jgi:hypothetical protein
MFVQLVMMQMKQQRQQQQQRNTVSAKQHAGSRML